MEEPTLYKKNILVLMITFQDIQGNNRLGKPINQNVNHTEILEPNLSIMKFGIILVESVALLNKVSNLTELNSFQYFTYFPVVYFYMFALNISFTVFH